MSESFSDLCKRLEHFETPVWAANAILAREPLMGTILDPCCGTGILTECAAEIYPYPDYRIWAFDIQHWGFEGTNEADFLSEDFKLHPSLNDGFSVFMNPPFSKACEFVEKSLKLGARKILCFQRFAWWESEARKSFWEDNPPSRVYICGNRATCWRHDIPNSERRSGTATAHAWFVWDRDSPAGTLLSHIWKDEAA